MREAAVLALASAGLAEAAGPAADLLGHGLRHHEIDGVFTPLRPFAATLLPVLRRHLRDTDSFEERRSVLRGGVLTHERHCRRSPR